MNCKQCGKCCSNYLPLTTEEVIRIKKLAKKENKRLLDKNWYNYCPFLNEQNKCDIYDNRPLICKYYTCEKFEKHLFDIEEVRELSKGNRQLVDLREVVFGGVNNEYKGENI